MKTHRIDRCPSCWELYPIDKMVPVKTGDEFQLYEDRQAEKPEERYRYNPIFSIIHLCEECFARLDNRT